MRSLGALIAMALVSSTVIADAAPKKKPAATKSAKAKKKPAAAAAPRTAVIGDKAVAAAVVRGLGKKVNIVNVGHPDAGIDPTRLAEAHGLQVVIVCSTGGTKRAPIAKVVVYAGASGDVIGRAEQRGPAGQAGTKLANEIWRKEGRAMAAAPKAQEPEPEQVAEEPPPPAREPERVSTTVSARSEVKADASGELSIRGESGGPQGVPRLQLSVEDRPFWRRLRYKDDLNAVLRSSDLVAHALGVTASYAPLAKMPALVIEGHVEFGVGINGSKTSDGQTFGTTTSEFSLGAAYRRRFGKTLAAADVAYGQQSFAIDDEELMEELVPDVAYKWLRVGVSGERPVAKKWTANAMLGYRKLLDAGELDDEEWFPRASGSGVDVAVGAEYAVTKRIRAYARLEMRRYFFAMNPEPGDAFIAGGMTDDYVGGAIGAAMGW